MEITLAENIKKMRNERGLTQGELARALSVTPQSVSRWEKGQAYPDTELLPVIAAFFDTTLDELMMGRPAVSFEKLLGMLAKAKSEFCASPSKATQWRVCDVLELITAHPKSNPYYLGQYFCQLMHLKHKWGGVPAERIDKVRGKFRQCLRDATPDERLHLLTEVVCFEEEDKLVLWREYLPRHYDMPRTVDFSWNDLLLGRYAYLGDEAQWEGNRQRILYRLIGRTLGLLIEESPTVPQEQRKLHDHGRLQDVAQCETAMTLLNIASSRADDVFLSLRLSMEFAYAGALFAAGDREKGFAMLSLVEEHTALLWRLEREGAVLHGSVPFLSQVEEKVDHRYTAGGYGWGYNDVFGYEKRHEFDSVRDDERFRMYVSRMEYIIPHTHYIGNEAKSLENIPDFAETFEPMRELAYNALRAADGDLKTQVTVFRTSEGNLYHVVEPDAMSGQPKTLALLERMREKQDCRIDRCLTMWWRFGGEVDVPSYEVRETMALVDPQNAETKILLLSGDHYAAPPLSRLLH